MDILTVLPPAAAVVIALISRNVYAALLIALFLSELLIASANPALGTLGAIDRVVSIFESPNSTRIVMFCLLIGALIVYMRDSGGVAGTAKALINSRFAKTSRRAESAVAAVGTVVFIETNVSLLSSGILGRSLYDAHGLSRERLAYVIDSTSAPISVLVLLNAWGAYVLALLEPFQLEKPVTVLVGSVGLNFYALLTVAGVYLTAATGRVFGPMRLADKKSSQLNETRTAAPTRPIYMWLPLTVMVGCALGFMAWTGDGDIRSGSGPQSMMWAVTFALVVAVLLLRFDRVFTVDELQQKAFNGIAEMIPVITVMILSISLGASVLDLGTGAYISELASGNLPPFLVPVIVFLAAATTSFMIGTSWGTYAIFVPLAMPVALALNVPPSLALAAVLGGGVFGDHCSPISDTTVMASVAAGSDHLSHVRTQLPYALAAGMVAGCLYLVAGFIVVF